MKSICSLCLCLLACVLFSQQNPTCSDDPPNNPWLADSPWPTFHRNAYRQASTCIAGPTQTDNIVIKQRIDIGGGTSPWVYLSEVYPTGERVLMQSNSTHIVKHIDTGQGIQTVDSLRIDFDSFTSFGYAFVQTRENKWFVPDPKFDPANDVYSRIIKIEDADPTNPYSELVQTGEFSFEGTNVTEVNHLALNFNGEIVFTGETDDANDIAHVGLLDQDLNVLDIFEFSTFPDEIINHNSSPVDENNSWYLVTTHRLIKFDWDGTDVSIGWQALYDFVNDGPTGAFAEGSGTTPTLIGYASDEDKLVVVADGHNQNNLVAFWRELPSGWTAIPGQDIRFADAIQIPLAQASNNLFQSIENSPTAHNYSIAIAQYNGFLGYDCDNDKGVQKFTWNTTANQWELDWVNSDINMNGVLTYSEGSNLVYSSGKELDCNYYMYGLNWDTGELDFRFLLGPEGPFLNDTYYDAGNHTIIDDNGHIFFSGGASLVKLEVNNNLSVADNTLNDLINISPNPTERFIKVKNESHLDIDGYRVLDTTGRVVVDKKFRFNWISLRKVNPGIYFLELKLGSKRVVKRFIKR